MMDVNPTYERLCSHARETKLLGTVQSLLYWDERTKMPPAGGGYRAEQIAYLAGQIHQKQTAPQVGEWLTELIESPLSAGAHSETGTVIRCLKRDFDKKSKLPQALVEELARTAVLGQQVWSAAREENDFGTFRPLLEKTIKLKQQEAKAIGYDDALYDALLDDYEPGANTADVTQVLGDLRAELVPLVAEIQSSGRQPNIGILNRHFPIDVQESFGTRAAAAIGFDFRAGRLDVTDHPFCCEVGPRDTRITTRYNADEFTSGLFSILHEAGHGVYEQRLPPEHFGLPTGQAISLGIHESQSRLWENLVGRSYAFWEHFFPIAQADFPTALREVGLDDFYFAINDVRPSLIRTEADEVTYNLHILIRFELELALLGDDLPAADLPAAWNERYCNYLGIDPPDDASGVLQDVHWSAGLWGYFPTYSLGNLFASQLFAAAIDHLGDLAAQFRIGQFGLLLEWLKTHVYQHGRRYSAGELAERVTGRPLSHIPLMQHLRSKYFALYELS